MIKKIKTISILILIFSLFNGCSYYGERLIVDIERGVFKAFGK